MFAHQRTKSMKKPMTWRLWKNQWRIKGVVPSSFTPAYILTHASSAFQFVRHMFYLIPPGVLHHSCTTSTGNHLLAVMWHCVDLPQLRTPEASFTDTFVNLGSTWTVLGEIPLVKLILGVRIPCMKPIGNNESCSVNGWWLNRFSWMND